MFEGCGRGVKRGGVSEFEFGRSATLFMHVNVKRIEIDGTSLLLQLSIQRGRMAAIELQSDDWEHAE